MGLRTALLLTVVVLISCSHGKTTHKKSADQGSMPGEMTGISASMQAIRAQAAKMHWRVADSAVQGSMPGGHASKKAIQDQGAKKHLRNIPAPSLRTANGDKSMDVINHQAAYLSNKNKDVTKGPPCDELFSWTYIRPGSSMEIRSRWLGKAMNFPETCGWSFWSDDGQKLSIMCDDVDIRETDYLIAHDYYLDTDIGWQGETFSSLDVTADFHSSEIAFGLESNQVRDKRSFECTVTTIQGCLDGQFWCPTGIRKCIGLKAVCDLTEDCDTNEDELDECSSSPPCPEGFARCATGQCMPSYYTCTDVNACEFNNGAGDCVTASSAEGSCDIAEFSCADSTCIESSKRCDLAPTPDCPDGSDEWNCGLQVCPDDHFQCDTTKCLAPHRVCDSNSDCTDVSDEVDCFWKTD